MKYHDELMRLLQGIVGANALGEDAGLSAGSLKLALPAATFAAFEFDSALLFGDRVVFARPAIDMKPRALGAHMHTIARACGCRAACLLDAPSPYLKKSLMADAVGFVTLQGEFFLPALLRLRPSRAEGMPVTRAEPSATGKSVYLHLLYAEGGSTVSGMAERLGLSRAGVQRACEGLLVRGLVTRTTGGPTRRTAIYERVEGSDYFDAGWEAFGPAARRVRTVPLARAEGLPACGLSALAARTMLAPPSVPEFAVHVKREGALLGAGPDPSEPTAVVHVLPYDPTPFVRDGMVDPFTMLKTLSRHDERIDMAVDEVKEGMGWLT